VIASRKAFIIVVGLLLAAQVFFVSTVAAEEGTVDSETVERLERLIKEQQQQLESLQQQVNELKKTATEAQTEAKEAKSVAEEAKTTVQAPLKKVVTSAGGERIKLAISGQVNRAVNIAEDGKNTKAYFVDSDASNTRVRFVGTAKLMQLVMVAHTHALLGPEQAGYGLPPGALWRHSVGVALACQILAEQLGMAEKGLSFTVGLLHDIGKIVLNENIGAEYASIVRLVNQERISFLEAERRALGITHAEVGELVARRWGLPDPIPCCIRYHHEPSALPTPDPIVDTLHLADALCLLLGVGGGDDSQMYRVDEAVLERVGVAPGEIETISAAIVHELKSVQQLFSME